jgi:tRNA-splicing ligase RtcB
MMERVKNAFTDTLNDVDFSNFINKPHNFAAWENHFEQNVIVHRKGATRARKGEFGMIPGSQGSSSYIVKGKGDAESFDSCSHGAGRLMSRTKARNTLSVEKETKQLEDMGVIHAIRDESDLDEAPSSYKDIKQVMAYQTDLVDIEIELRPLAVIKG